MYIDTYSEIHAIYGQTEKEQQKKKTSYSSFVIPITNNKRPQCVFQCLSSSAKQVKQWSQSTWLPSVNNYFIIGKSFESKY